MRVRWALVLEHAAAIVWSHDTSVTLRRLFYRLVADGMLTNEQTTTAGCPRTRLKHVGRAPLGWPPSRGDAQWGSV
ncbi:MAG: hypothetical protein ACXWX4_10520, partial [Actinomycetota bacterium]